MHGVVTIGLKQYAFPDNVCQGCSYDTQILSEIFFDGIHHPCLIRFIDLRQHIRFLHSSLSFFCHANRCTVSSHTPIISQSKVHHYLWWNRKTASFRFSLAMTDTCCPLSGVLLAFLPPGSLVRLQMSSTFLSVRTISLSGLSTPYSLMSNLAALGLNPSQMCISWSHEVIISGHHSQQTH